MLRRQCWCEYRTESSVGRVDKAAIWHKREQVSEVAVKTVYGFVSTGLSLQRRRIRNICCSCLASIFLLWHKACRETLLANVNAVDLTDSSDCKLLLWYYRNSTPRYERFFGPCLHHTDSQRVMQGSWIGLQGLTPQTCFTISKQTKQTVLAKQQFQRSFCQILFALRCPCRLFVSLKKFSVSLHTSFWHIRVQIIPFHGSLSYHQNVPINFQYLQRSLCLPTTTSISADEAGAGAGATVVLLNIVVTAPFAVMQRPVVAFKIGVVHPLSGSAAVKHLTDLGDSAALTHIAAVQRIVAEADQKRKRNIQSMRTR